MNLSSIPRGAASAAALTALLLSTGCAAALGNTGTLVLARHISIGQELMDLHEAQKTGAITEEEYVIMKAKLMEAVESIEFVESMNDVTSDQVTERLPD